MAITLNGTTGITTPDLTSEAGLTVDGVSFASGAPANTLVTTSGGNVGVGTSSPQGKLQVKGDSNADVFYLTDANEDDRGLMFSNSSNGIIWDINAKGASGSFGQISFSTNSSERARIDSSGNLLVGKTGRLAGEKLSVEASGASGNTCAFIYGSADDRAIVISLHAGSSGGTSRKHYAFLDGGGFERGYITVNGSSTTYATSSDYRLKENIAPMAGALSVVQQLKPCTYTWKNSGIAGQGFIAHELAEVCPDAVTGEKDAVDAEGNPQYQGIDTSFLVATLTAAIQELKTINDAQAQTIESLTARVVALEGQQ